MLNNIYVWINSYFPGLRPSSSLAAFTIIEMLLTIALISIIAGFSVPVYRNLHTKNYLDLDVHTIVQFLRNTQIHARAMTLDSSWGLKIQNSSIIMFKGSDYAGRDADFDKVFNLAGSISSSGLEEIIFDKFSGEVQNSGSITLSTPNQQYRTISISKPGLIEY